MKKTIKAELVSLAHKILQLRDTADYTDMAMQARKLQEKLTILAYAEKLEKMGMPTIGLKQVEQEMVHTQDLGLAQASPQEQEVKAPQTIPIFVKPEATPVIKTPAQIVAENQARYAQAKATDNDHHRPDGTQYNEEDPVHEPVIEKIKDMWPEMTPEAADIDKVLDAILPQQQATEKNDSFEIGNEYAQTPIFEAKDTTVQTIEEEKPKNLNDRLKTGLKIGLNDKLSFIKHLFNGSASDYNRVLSQLETFGSEDEAQAFISQMVKPDYNRWEGKEVQEERFMSIVGSKFN